MSIKDLGTPVVEVTSFIFEDKRYLAENWRGHWQKEGSKELYVLIRDTKTNEIISRAMDGFNLVSAYVIQNYVYLIGPKREENLWRNLYISRSQDLRDWSKPRSMIIRDGGTYNQSICFNGETHVMAYETNEFLPFSIRFASSKNLETWDDIGVVFDEDKYTACPFLTFVNSYYYMFYTVRPTEEWKFEIWTARSKDLKEWEISEKNPVISSNILGTDEVNVSDFDMIEWKGQTYIYFTGGHQRTGGKLREWRYNGSAREFVEDLFRGTEDEYP